MKFRFPPQQQLFRATLLCGGLMLAPAPYAGAQELPGAVQRAPIERASPQPPALRAEPDEHEKQGLQPIPDPRPDEIAFVLQGIELAGASTAGPKDLFDEFNSLLYKRVTLSQLQVLAQNIATRYRNEGFLLAQAFVPVQTVHEGVVQIRIIEGHFGECRLQEESGQQDALLRRYLDELCRTRPMKVAALERYMLLMNDVPGVQAQAVIVPGASTDSSPDLTVQIRRRSAAARVGVTNRELKALGTWRMDFDGELYNGFGLNGRHWVQYRHSAGGRLNTCVVGHELPLGRNGTKWSVSLGAGTAQSTLNGAQVRSDVHALDVNLTHPWLRSRTRNLTMRGTVSALNSNVELERLEFLDDRVRSARVGMTYDFVDRTRGLNVADLQLSQGFDVFGAHSTGHASASRTNGRSDYTKLNLYTAHLQPITERFSVLAALQGQYSQQPLLVPEQFALGGEQWLRAYDASEMLGDSGFGGKLELRYNLTASGAASMYGYYDYGRVYSNDSSLPNQDAASAGAGLRVSLRQQLYAYVEGALPLGRDVAAAGNRSPRAFGGVQLAF